LSPRCEAGGDPGKIGGDNETVTSFSLIPHLEAFMPRFARFVAIVAVLFAAPRLGL